MYQISLILCTDNIKSSNAIDQNILVWNFQDFPLETAEHNNKEFCHSSMEQIVLKYNQLDTNPYIKFDYYIL